jgi:hypothetical protein
MTHRVTHGAYLQGADATSCGSPRCGQLTSKLNYIRFYPESRSIACDFLPFFIPFSFVERAFVQKKNQPDKPCRPLQLVLLSTTLHRWVTVTRPRNRVF